MNLRSSWTAETGQTREDTRLTQTGATTPLNTVQVRSGILPGSYDGRYRLSGLWMDKASAMTATVHEGRAVIQGSISQGAYPVTLPASQEVTFAAGDAQYSRVDLVVARIYDNLYDSSNRNEAKIEVVQGVPGQAPQAPAAPPLSLPLWEVTVPAGASAGNGGIPWGTALKDLRTPTVSLGGINPVEGPTQRGTYPGQYQDTPNGELQRWDGGQWVSYPAGVGGIVPANVPLEQGGYVGQYRDGTSGQFQRWNGTAWKPAFPGPYFNGTYDEGWTTSTTFTTALTDTLSTPLGVDFVAPPSGAVLITYGARMYAPAPTPPALAMSLRLTQAGTTKIEAGDEGSVVYTGATPASMSTVTRFYGMVPGLTYTVTALFKVGSNTSQIKGYFDNTFVMVQHHN
ncbi:hypothetical protein ABZ318_15720 [Streptomyces sp. NPDC006197]|uniref:hypothetical protein n=1 Tax=Streptomyces sp. NPDC006197 TaxID=3156685 RepID=UPI0033BF2C60